MAVRSAIDVSELLKPGVYLLSNHGRVVYVGKAKMLLIALGQQAIRNRDSALPSWFPVKRIAFDQIEIIPCDPSTAHIYAAALIEFHNPLHNREPRHHEPITATPPPPSAPTTPAPRRLP